jgi:hypothetical protein
MFAPGLLMAFGRAPQIRLLSCYVWHVNLLFEQAKLLFGLRGS